LRNRISPRPWTTKARQAATRASWSSRTRSREAATNCWHKLTILAQTERGRRKSGHANLPKHRRNRKIGARSRRRKHFRPPNAGEKKQLATSAVSRIDSCARYQTPRHSNNQATSLARAQSSNVAQASSTQPNLEEGKAAVGHITTAVVPLRPHLAIHNNRRPSTQENTRVGRRATEPARAETSAVAIGTNGLLYTAATQPLRSR